MLIMFVTDFIYILVTYVLTIKIICNNSIIHYSIIIIYTAYVCMSTHTHKSDAVLIFSLHPWGFESSTAAAKHRSEPQGQAGSLGAACPPALQPV